MNRYISAAAVLAVALGGLWYWNSGRSADSKLIPLTANAQSAS